MEDAAHDTDVEVGASHEADCRSWADIHDVRHDPSGGEEGQAAAARRRVLRQVETNPAQDQQV